MAIKSTHEELEKEVIEYRQEEETLLSRMQEIADVGIWRLNLKTYDVTWSDQVFKIFGQDSRTFKPNIEKVKDLIHRDDHEKTLSVIDDTVKTGKTGKFEQRIFRPDGEERLISVTIEPDYDTNGKLIDAYGVCRDITELKKAEDALRESEEKYRSLVENLPDIILTLARDGTILTINRMVTSGSTPEQAIGRKVDDFVSPEHSKKLRKNFKQVFETGKPLSYEERGPGPKGPESAFYDIRLVPLHDDGQVIAVMQISRDITERKHAEEALQESEERFRTFMETASDLMHIADKDGYFTYVNESMARTLGYSNKEMMGMHITRVLGMESFTKESFEKNFKPTIERLTREGEITLETIYVTKDGRKIQGERKSIAIYDSDGRYAGSRVIFRDLTERKRAEEERKKLETQLLQAQKMEAIGTLAGGIAHDFNNILMGIQGRASLMLMNADSSHPHFEHLKEIELYVKNAADLTKRLLGFARSGKYQVIPVNLNELIKSQNHMFGRTKKEITIHGKYEENLWAAEVDQGQLEQVLMNLYVNAWQAMPGGGDLFIQTENVNLDENDVKPFNVEPGKFIKISVSDTGSGMDNATKQKIFDPFFTTKGIGGGTGLGLASVYGIVKNHDGFIEVQSEKGAGSTFDIYLPTSEKEISKEKEPVEKIIKGKETILLIDDEDMIIDVSKQLLNQLDYEVLIAKNGEEAINIYQKNKDKIDMVILDMIMPGMSGSESFDRLVDFDPNIKVLLSSGYSINGQAREILDRGCRGFIQKPFNTKELSRKVRDILDTANPNPRRS